MGKVGFGVKTLYKTAFQSSECPYCGSRETTLVERKHMILQLRKCGQCMLSFRFPKDELSENNSFYQNAYRESTVTDLPATSELPGHIKNNFRNVGRDLTDHLQTIKAIAPSGKLLDYGSSWGYCVHQFRDAGYDAYGFEISRTRVEYGRKMLQVELSHSVETFADASFDVIYSAHCLEHIPNPAIPLAQFARLLKPGGHLFIYVPNCGGAEARKLGVRWGPMIGEKHVLALTAEFFHNNLPNYGFENLCFASSPYASAPQRYELSALEGEELLVVGVRS